jgi:WS/DGAT/MGAT family acyltransferase
MQRLTGQDASFLYTETPTVLMHTLKIQIFESAFDGTDYEIMRDRLEAALDVVPMLRQRVMFVPFNLHHPVMVDDPDFDLDSHIYRTALPAPGDDKELDQMISQIMCHRLDRQRPLWELWMITGLQDGKVAVVHKVHHCLADGAATVRYLGRVFEQQATYEPHSREAWRPKPLPPSRRLVWDALVDHFKYDIRRLPAFLSRLWRSARNLIAFNRDVGSPMIDTMMVHKPPRARFNHTLSARRNFARRQVPLQLVKEAGSALGGTVNDVVLAMAAGAIRNYLLHHRDLPSEPLCTSIPVSADEPGVRREMGNNTTFLPTCLWTNIGDPLERFQKIQKSTQIGKQELQVLGKDTFIELMHFMPPAISLWKTRRKQRLRPADRPDYHPMTNVVISNMPGPRERLSGNYGSLAELFSMGPLVEGCGLNITVWSYAGNLNFSLMSCMKAIPDLDRLADGLLAELAELQELGAPLDAERNMEEGQA